jgi:hypothetical protein
LKSAARDGDRAGLEAGRASSCAWSVIPAA